MIQDLPYILYWWAIIFSLGLVVFPLTKRLFSKFFDFGYPFAKILSILLLSYLVWLLGSLKILPFFRETTLLMIVLFALINFLISKNSKRFDLSRGRTSQRTSQNLKIIIFEEILFFLGLLFWAFVRSHEPSIHGLEKFMDYGFINSILRSKFFPPPDIWLSPSPDPRYTGSFTINYYYFGHLTAAVLTRLSGLDSAITYNLVLATLFGLCFSGAFSIGGNLLWINSKFKILSSKQILNSNVQNSKQGRFGKLGFRILFGGLLTAFLVTLAGNLHPIMLFIKDSTKYWYPDATRLIPFTIHEFPIYSWVVADLHGHVFDIPFVLLAIAMLIALLNSKLIPHVILSPALRGEGSQRGFFHFAPLSVRMTMKRIFFSDFGFRILLLGLVLAVLYMTNAWDGIIYLCLSGLVILATYLKSSRKPYQATKAQSSKLPPKARLAKGGKAQSYSDKVENTRQSRDNLKCKTAISFNLLALVFTFALLAFSFFLFSLPFNLNFHPFVKGIGVNCPPSFMPDKFGPFLFEKGNCQRSPLYMLAILWGFFYFNAAAFLIFLFKNSKSEARSSKQALSTKFKVLNKGLSSLKFRIWNLSRRFAEDPRLSSGLGTSNLGFRILRKVDIFLVLMIILSTFLLIFPEFFYAKDIYPAHFRANTMFKLGYQAFIMLSIVSGYTIIQLLTKIRKQKTAPSGLLDQISVKIEYQRKTVNLKFPTGCLRLSFYPALFFQLFLVSIYPYYAIISYYGNLKNYQSLDGIAWLQKQYPDDYQGIIWLQNQVVEVTSQPPVIAEAVGESYTDYSRVSSYTGLPTILGWPVHEWLWRGSYDEPGKRVPEVQTIYESQDAEQTKQMLKKYNVSYIFLGSLEREKYKNLNEEKFAQLGEVVFESGGTKIYKISSD